MQEPRPSDTISAWSKKYFANSGGVLATKVRRPAMQWACQPSRSIGLVPETAYSAGSEV